MEKQETPPRRRAATSAKKEMSATVDGDTLNFIGLLLQMVMWMAMR
jgi:hypothetical protein